MPRLGLVASLCAGAILLAGCAVGPDYRQPADKAPAAWQARLPHEGSPTELARWWSDFNDPNLERLIARAELDSPSLAESLAAIVKARATLTSARADGLPSVTATSSGTRARSQAVTGVGTTVGNSRSSDIDASWELDLFGKVRRNETAAQARIQERQADWNDGRVSLAAEVADDYVQYRGCLLLTDAYARAAKSNLETARLTANSVKAGFTARSDGDEADASAASALSSLHGEELQCEVLVKSLVELTGMPEPELRSWINAPGLPPLPQPTAFGVPAVPADVVRQRPDVVSLEREVAATSEEIGVAIADRYPSLSLSGLITLATSAGVSATTWSFGPSVSATLFDAGSGRAAVETARASYDSAVASYRQGVRTAVMEVEQALVRLDATARQTDDLTQATRGYSNAERASESLWRAGSTDLLSLEETRRSAISAETQLISMQQSHIQYWIALYKATGGGWQVGETPMPAQAAASAHSPSYE